MKQAKTIQQTMPRQPGPGVIDLPQEAAAYAHADFAEANRAFVERLVQLAGDFEKARCLDLGTGPADIPIRLARARPKWHITAVEASPPMLGFARHAVDQAGLAKAIELVHADAKSTGLRSGSFNIVFANSILHHIDNTLRFWYEIKRLGAAGSLVFLRDFHRPPTADAALEIVQEYYSSESPLLRKEHTRSLLAAYTPEEVRGQLASAKMSRLKLETVTDRHMDIVGWLE